MSVAKGIAIFVGGVLVGGAAGFIAGKVITEKVCEKEMNDEIADMREFYISKMQSKEKWAERMIDTVINDPKEETEIKVEPKDSLGKPKKGRKKKKTNYSDVEPENLEKETNMLAEKETPEEDLPTEPYVITREEFDNDHPEYEKITLEYYEDDNVVAEDSESIVDIDNTIGYDALTEFIDNENLEELYIRNNSLSTDFEITRVYGSYNETFHYDS